MKKEEVYFLIRHKTEPEKYLKQLSFYKPTTLPKGFEYIELTEKEKACE